MVHSLICNLTKPVVHQRGVLQRIGVILRVNLVGLTLVLRGVAGVGCKRRNVVLTNFTNLLKHVTDDFRRQTRYRHAQLHV